MSGKKKIPTSPSIRCAIYTRKSTDEGLDQEFNTLDAQRESGEAYVASQRHEGWESLPYHYDDGGFTGGNMDRPALRQLMTDIAAGKIDCVIVYKVDRLSRSLLDFSRMMEIFDKHNVSFVSVTQQFNTSTSMGRLVLNVLLSFAQFEREIISERTRDKIAAARRKGKWSGGMPILGYTVVKSKLMVDEREAKRVRQIFEKYLQHPSLLGVARDLNERGWRTKQWTTQKGTVRGGRVFDKNSLYQLLTNITYLGKLRYKEEIHDGEHEAIVSQELWQRVQTLLSRNGRTGGAAVRNKFGAFLKGILHCSPCNAAMTPSHTTKNGHKRYRYYVCTNAQKRGWHNCPSKSLPAGEIERFVVEQLKTIGRDPALFRETVAQTHSLGTSERQALKSELRSLQRDLTHWNEEVRQLLQHIAPHDRETPATQRLADLQERLRSGERRATDLQKQLLALDRTTIDEADVAAALAKFEPVWESLPPQEQARLIELLVDRIDYDGATGNVTIAFHACGIKRLAEDLEQEEAA